MPIVETIAFKTDNPESVAPKLREFWSGQVVVPHESGPAGYELTALRSQRLSVGKISARVGLTSRASAARPMLQIPLDCTADFRVGRTRFAIGPGQAILLPPGHEYTAHVSAGSAGFIQVDETVLVRGLPAGRAGRLRHWAMRCVPIDVSRAAGINLRAEVDSLLQAPASRSFDDRSTEFADLEHRLVSWLPGALVDRGGLRSFVPAGSLLAECAGEWIEANLSASITLDTLARQFGVSGRWLQKCFMARWGLTPTDYVMNRRLALVRSCLMSPDSPSVTSAAIRCGFSHLGRFAGLYRKTYGESPSETVTRAARRRLSARAKFAIGRAPDPSVHQSIGAP
jgi:AraC-like DNA-binding protein